MEIKNTTEKMSYDLKFLSYKIPVTGYFEFNNYNYELTQQSRLYIEQEKYGNIYISGLETGFININDVRDIIASLYDDYGLLDVNATDNNKRIKEREKNEKIMDEIKQQIVVFAKIIYYKAKSLEQKYQKEQIQSIPQKYVLSMNAILLSEYFDGKTVIRAYNEWDDNKKILYQFITKNGGEPLYTRGAYRASYNFSSFWKVVNIGINTYAGAKYKSKHGDKMYSRDRIF